MKFWSHFSAKAGHFELFQLLAFLIFIQVQTGERDALYSVFERASAFHYNPNYFIRYFKSMFNLSPYQYITKIRLEKAQWMLTYTEISISQIAESFGIKPVHFTKMFKQGRLNTGICIEIKARPMFNTMGFNEIVDISPEDYLPERGPTSEAVSGLLNLASLSLDRMF